MGGETTNDQTRDDIWMNALLTKTRATTPWAMQAHVRKWVCEKIRVWGCFVHTSWDLCALQSGILWWNDDQTRDVCEKACWTWEWGRTDTCLFSLQTARTPDGTVGWTRRFDLQDRRQEFTHRTIRSRKIVPEPLWRRAAFWNPPRTPPATQQTHQITTGILCATVRVFQFLLNIWTDPLSRYEVKPARWLISAARNFLTLVRNLRKMSAQRSSTKSLCVPRPCGRETLVKTLKINRWTICDS